MTSAQVRKVHLHFTQAWNCTFDLEGRPHEENHKTSLDFQWGGKRLMFTLVVVRVRALVQLAYARVGNHR